MSLYNVFHGIRSLVLFSLFTVVGGLLTWVYFLQTLLCCWRRPTTAIPKTIAITGASKGIGAALALEYALPVSFAQPCHCLFVEP